MGRPKPKAVKDREGRWYDIIAAYRRRHRQWVMECMPQMHAGQWDEYTKWIAGFGSARMGLSSQNSRKVRRQLKAARTPPKPKVTGTVTFPDPMPSHLADAMGYLTTKHTRMRFAYGIGDHAQEAGRAKKGSATRRG